MICCKKCSTTPEKSRGFHRVASISGGIMGNEHTDTYYYCQDCQCFTCERYVDFFDGREASALDGPISKEEGARALALIRQCETPYEKRCRCNAHREYFGDALD
jgi:hypothetical protein